jgi:hypothetical protein
MMAGFKPKEVVGKNPAFLIDEKGERMKAITIRMPEEILDWLREKAALETIKQKKHFSINSYIVGVLGHEMELDRKKEGQNQGHSNWQIDYFAPTGKRVRRSFKKKKDAMDELAKRESLICRESIPGGEEGLHRSYL